MLVTFTYLSSVYFQDSEWMYLCFVNIYIKRPSPLWRQRFVDSVWGPWLYFAVSVQGVSILTPCSVLNAK